LFALVYLFSVFFLVRVGHHVAHGRVRGVRLTRRHFLDGRFGHELPGLARVVDPDPVERHHPFAGFDLPFELDVVVVVPGPLLFLVVGVKPDRIHRKLPGNGLGEPNRNSLVALVLDEKPDRRNRELVGGELFFDADPVSLDGDFLRSVTGIAHITIRVHTRP